MTNRKNAAYTLLFVIGLAGWIVCWFMLMTITPKKPAKPTLITVTCEGCGTTWESHEGHRERIQKCPNCPMSEEEFEALKEAIRNSHKGSER